MMLIGAGTWTGTSLRLHRWEYSRAADLMSSLAVEQSLYQDRDPARTWTQDRMASVVVQLIIMAPISRLWSPSPLHYISVIYWLGVDLKETSHTTRIQVLNELKITQAAGEPIH